MPRAEDDAGGARGGAARRDAAVATVAACAAEPSVERYLRTRFLALIAHDVLDPMSVTRTALDELEAAYVAELGGRPAGDQASHYSAMARRALLRLQRLAERLRMASQLEEGRVELVRAKTDVAKLVRDAVDEALLLNARSRVSVRAELPDAPAWDAVDATWLRRAFVEIVGNALRHAASEVRVRLAAERGLVRVSIEDDGRGVAPDARATMFLRFVPREWPSQGLRLGLSVAHDAVAAHGGRVTFDEDAGRTRFVVELPSAVAAA